MFHDHREPFPPDPNAPTTKRDRAAGFPRLVLQAPTDVEQIALAIERGLEQVRLIGPAAGAELRRIVYGDGHDQRHPRPLAPSTPVGAAPTRSDASAATAGGVAGARTPEGPHGSQTGVGYTNEVRDRDANG